MVGQMVASGGGGREVHTADHPEQYILLVCQPCWQQLSGSPKAELDGL